MQYQQIKIKQRQQTEILNWISAMEAPKYLGNLNCFLSKLTIHNSLDSLFEPGRIKQQQQQQKMLHAHQTNQSCAGTLKFKTKLKW